MNKALTERFLVLIPHEHRTTYNVLLIRDPNRRFGVTFQHFYDQFGVKDELELVPVAVLWKQIGRASCRERV